MLVVCECFRVGVSSWMAAVLFLKYGYPPTSSDFDARMPFRQDARFAFSAQGTSVTGVLGLGGEGTGYEQ